MRLVNKHTSYQGTMQGSLKILGLLISYTAHQSPACRNRHMLKSAVSYPRSAQYCSYQFMHRGRSNGRKCKNGKSGAGVIRVRASIWTTENADSGPSSTAVSPASRDRDPPSCTPTGRVPILRAAAHCLCHPRLVFQDF